ncbi:MAG: DUF2079 domain-containing protein [Candidatus Dormibacteraceae bacterium]
MGRLRASPALTARASRLGIRRRRAPPIPLSSGAAACLSAAAAFLLCLRTLLQRAAALQLPAYDTAFFEQVVWNLGHGNGWTSGYSAASFLGLHFEPLLLLPALLERVIPNWELLLVLESLGLAASAPAAYLFLRALLGGRRHAPIAAAALSAPLPFWILLQNAAVGAFHTETLALPLLLLAGWLGLRDRWRLCWPLLLVALTAKEDAAYGALVIGLLLFFFSPSRLQGAAVAGLSVVWAAVLELWLMPHLLEGTTSDLASYYAWLHQATPATVARHLAQPAGWVALALAIAGMAALPLLRPGWLLLAAPPFLGSLLSDHWPQPALHLQYGLPIVLPVFVAGGLGAARLLDTEMPRARRLLSAPAVAALCLPALVLGAALGPLAGQAPAIGPPLVEQLARCVAVIPAAAPVSTDDDIAVWLAARPDEVPLTRGRGSDWLIVDVGLTPPRYVAADRRARILGRLPASGRVLACSTGRFQVWTPVR